MKEKKAVSRKEGAERQKLQNLITSVIFRQSDRFDSGMVIDAVKGQIGGFRDREQETAVQEMTAHTIELFVQNHVIDKIEGTAQYINRELILRP